MKIPFTTEQFFEVIEKYNLAMFPAQILIILLGTVCWILIHSNKSYKDKFIGGFLGLLWIWMGIAYHLSFFTAINKAAFAFGGIFILQGILLLANVFIGTRLTFSFSHHAKDYIGYFFVLFGLIIYTIIGYSVDGTTAQTISLGLPCPSTIFTFGFLMLAGNKLPKYLLIIPSIWAVIGFTPAIKFGVYQDIMLLVAALVSLFYVLRQKRA